MAHNVIFSGVNELLLDNVVIKLNVTTFFIRIEKVLLIWAYTQQQQEEVTLSQNISKLYQE